MLIGAVVVDDVIEGVVVAEEVVIESDVFDHFPILGADAIAASRRRR